MLEFEKKILLSRKEYTALLWTMGKDVAPKIQTNYYFDTDDYAMNQKGITCRVRSKNGMYQAVVKSHVRDISDCSVESTSEVQDEFDINVFREMGLHIQGSLVTERTIIYEDTFCKAVLDRNLYLGCIDYELEIEYSEGYESHALHVLHQAAEILLLNRCISGVEEFHCRVGASQSKSERFFERKAMNA